MEKSEAPLLNIIGEKVALGPLRHDLIHLECQWINDFEVTRTLMGNYPHTLESEEDWYQHASRSSGDRHFLIYEKATMRAIGGTALHDINLQHRVATFGLMIGAKDCWGKGYGTETASLMLEYGFSILNLHNIMLQVYSFNERAIRAYLKAGFQEIGRRREARWMGGKAYDIIMMDCLSTGYPQKALHSILPMSEERTDP